MIYVYDILLNFNKELIEYFEWVRSDNIKYAKKICLFKISKNSLRDFLNYEIEFDSLFVKSTNKYELDGLDNKISYALFTDGYMVIGVCINNNKLELVSRLIVDEEDEVISMSKKLSNYNISYKKLGLKKKDNRLLTRNERYKLDLMKEEIKKLYNNKSFDKLKYLYYELTLKSSDNINYIYKSLLDSLVFYNEKHEKLFEILNMANKKISK